MNSIETYSHNQIKQLCNYLMPKFCKTVIPLFYRMSMKFILGIILSLLGNFQQVNCGKCWVYRKYYLYWIRITKNSALHFLYNFLYNHDLECTYWPSSKNLCSDDGEEAIVLDSSVRNSDFQKCENLCRNEGGEGCCFLTDSNGCKWKKGSVATSVSMGEQNYFAITCSFSGTIVVL